MATMQHQDMPSPDASAEQLVAGRYRLLSVLGEGGMGTVWCALDEVLHREVAVKEVRAPAGMAAELVTRMYTRLEREAWAAARVSAPGVVTVHDVVKHDGRPWIVMEFVRGRSLADVIASEGVLPPREVARIGFEVLAALRAAHRARVLHRDVKPANVLLADDGRVVLTDFGIATVEGDTALTMTGEVIGSPEYLAPERALGRDPGTSSDLWSLGALLYTAVQGRSPFRRTSPLATLRAVVDDQLPPPHRAGPLAPVIEGLMHKDPIDRLSADQAERELRLVYVEGAVAGAPVPAAGAVGEAATAESALGETAPAPVPGSSTTAAATATTAGTTATTCAPASGDAQHPGDTVAALAGESRGADATSATTAPAPRSTGDETAETASAATVGTPVSVGRIEGPASPAEDPLTGTVPTASIRTVVPAPRPPADTGSVPTVDIPDAVAPALAALPAVPDRPPGAASALGPGAGTRPRTARSAAVPAHPAADGHASGFTPERRRPRTGCLIGAGATSLALFVGLVGTTLLGGDGEGNTAGGDTPRSQARDATVGAAADSAPDATAGQPVGITVTGTATAYAGDCPPGNGRAPSFTATFTVARAPIQFFYRWVSTNGAVADRQWRILAFREGDPRTHQETVRLSTYARAGTLRSDIAVEIKSPFAAKSNVVPFSLSCAATPNG